MNSLEEQKLLSKIQNGDSEAFGKIYDKYAEKIYRFVWIKVNSREQAQDLTSEVFLKGWRYLTKNGIKKVKVKNLQAFLYKTARNIIIDFYRKPNNSISIEEIDKDIIEEEFNLNEKLYLEDDFKEIKNALGKIKDEYSHVIIFHYIEDLSAKEIAEILDKSEGTVRVLIHRAMKALKNELE